MKMIYWKSEKFWLGKLLEHPEIMTQGETLQELEENLKDAYLMMAMDDVPQKYEVKEISIWSEKSLLGNWQKRVVFCCEMVRDTTFIWIRWMEESSLYRDTQKLMSGWQNILKIF